MISGKYGLRRVKYNLNNTKLTEEVDRIHGTCPLTATVKAGHSNMKCWMVSEVAATAG